MKAFTDGACSGNPGPGGWAWVTENGRHASGSEADSTNQRMELTAVLRALEALDGPVHIHSDSTYVVNCFLDRWYEGWIAKGWKNSQRKPVANRDLWEPLVELYLSRQDEIEFTWVKGHAGNRLNELADSLAVAEVEKLKEGLAPAPTPTDLPGPIGGPTAAAAPGGPAAPWPVDQAIVISGVRELDDDLREGLGDAVDRLDPMNDIVVSGLRLGAELEGAERGLDRGLPLAVVLPFADPVKVWSANDRKRFDEAVAAASWVVTLDGDRARPGPAIAERDAWLNNAAIGAIIVGDEKRAAAAELAGLGVIAVDP